MSEQNTTSRLLQIAARIAAQQSKETAEGDDVSQRALAVRRAGQRLALDQYLNTLIDFLVQNDLPAEGLLPLIWLKDQMSSIDNYGASPPIFIGGEQAIGISEPRKRLAAEGHAAGCVAYLHEAGGLRIMEACEVVASIFSAVGHTGRVKNSRNNKTPQPLSSKTVYDWHRQLNSSPDETDGLALAIRKFARLDALMSLIKETRQELQSNWPNPLSRELQAEMIFNIALRTRLGAPDGQVKLEAFSGSTDLNQTD